MKKILLSGVQRAAVACELDVVIGYAVTERAVRRIPDLDFDVEYTLREICGEDFWRRYNHVARRVGRFFALLVRHGFLPLRLSRIRSDRNRLYRRT